MTRRAAAFALAGVAARRSSPALLDVAPGPGRRRRLERDLPRGDVARRRAVPRHPAAARARRGWSRASRWPAPRSCCRRSRATRWPSPRRSGLTAGGALTVTLVAAYASLAPGAPTIAVAFVGVAAGTLLIGAMAAAGGGGIRLILAGHGGRAGAGGGDRRPCGSRARPRRAGCSCGAPGQLLQTGWGPVRAAAS